MYVYICVSQYIYAMLEGTFGSYKWASDILRLELQAVECRLTQVPRMELGSSGKEEGDLNC